MKRLFKKTKWVVNCTGKGYEKAIIVKAIFPGSACAVAVNKLGEGIEILSVVPYSKAK